MNEEVSSQQAAENVLILEVDEAVEERIVQTLEKILEGKEPKYDAMRDRIFVAIEWAKQRKEANMQQLMMQYQMQAQKHSMQQAAMQRYAQGGLINKIANTGTELRTGTAVEIQEKIKAAEQQMKNKPWFSKFNKTHFGF